MMRLRCTLFGRLMRERRDRDLNPFERDFVSRHTLVCSDCRARMHISDMGLDALARARLEPDEPDELSFVKIPRDRTERDRTERDRTDPGTGVLGRLFGF